VKEISPELVAYRARWKNGIEGIEKGKKERIIETANKLIED
jgi:hypothetical protein